MHVEAQDGGGGSAPHKSGTPTHVHTHTDTTDGLYTLTHTYHIPGWPRQRSACFHKPPAPHYSRVPPAQEAPPDVPPSAQHKSINLPPVNTWAPAPLLIYMGNICFKCYSPGDKTECAVCPFVYIFVCIPVREIQSLQYIPKDKETERGSVSKTVSHANTSPDKV